MKNALLFMSLLFLLSLTSIHCRKPELDNKQYAVWYLNIGGVTHHYVSNNVPNGFIDGNYFSCTKDTSIQMFFEFGDPTRGAYHIVSETKAANKTLGFQEIAIEFNIGLSDVYLSIDGADTVNIIDISGGNYPQKNEAIIQDNIKFVHFNNGVALDTVTGGGHMYW
jgi:hypothetical protein